MRYFCLFVWLLIPVLKTYAQHTLNGRVFEQGTRIPLAGIRIQDMKNKKFTETDINGKFSIAANVNDLLVFTGFAYQADTVLVTALKTTEVFLAPQKNILKQVNVSTQEIKGSFRSYDPDFHGQTITKQLDANGNYKGGIVIRIWSNKKEEHKQAKLQQLELTDRVERIIDTVFSVENLARFLPLKGDDLVSFRIRYMPAVKQYLNNDFNLITYLNACYKKFIALPPAERKIPPLVEP